LTFGQILNYGSWYKGDQWGITDIKMPNGTVFYQYLSLADGVDTNKCPTAASYAGVVGSPAKDGIDWPTTGHAVAPNSLLGLLRTHTGVDFDIPTDAQWEYCCRAGTTGSFNVPDTDVKDLAWLDSTGKKIHPVGEKIPNAWGLYDFHGSVYEMCRDWFVDHLGSDPVIDPKGPATGSYRTARGGKFDWAWTYTRSAFRVPFTGGNDNGTSVTGVRLICPVGLKWPVQEDTRMIAVDYTLAADAIVTFDVQTNRTGAATADAEDWVSIGESNFVNAFGDVNRLVPAGDRQIFWRADRIWADRYVPQGALRTVVKNWSTNTPPDYMVVDLAEASEQRIRYFVSTNALPEGGLANDIYRKRYLVMRRIPAQGTTWCMGQDPSIEVGTTGADAPATTSFSRRRRSCRFHAIGSSTCPCRR